MTARSVSGSVPTMVAASFSPVAGHLELVDEVAVVVGDHVVVGDDHAVRGVDDPGAFSRVLVLLLQRVSLAHVSMPLDRDVDHARAQYRRHRLGRAGRGRRRWPPR